MRLIVFILCLIFVVCAKFESEKVGVEQEIKLSELRTHTYTINTYVWVWLDGLNVEYINTVIINKSKIDSTAKAEKVKAEVIAKRCKAILQENLG